MKQRHVLMLFSIIVLVGLVGGGIWLYDWVLGSPLEASQPISAAPVALPTTTQQPAASQPAVPQSPATQPAGSPPTNPAPAETQPAASQPEPEPPAQSSGPTRFSIQQELSQVSFTIYEELNGAPKDVIGVSNQVAGEAAFDSNDLSQVLLGEIRFNARTLLTDDDRRNNAIRNRILNTDRFEFISFTPTGISDLSGSAVVGQPYTFQITGDLTIRDVTQPTVFAVTATLENEQRLVGSASTLIKRGDFNLLIPSVPFVANVGDDVSLQIDFVMTP